MFSEMPLEEEGMSQIKDSLLDLIGNTPIVNLSSYAEAAGVKDAKILAKLE